MVCHFSSSNSGEFWLLLLSGALFGPCLASTRYLREALSAPLQIIFTGAEANPQSLQKVQIYPFLSFDIYFRVLYILQFMGDKVDVDPVVMHFEKDIYR